jgi:uncharacterized alpha-E superfamily protein
MWETMNFTWLETRGQTFEHIAAKGIGDYFEWVKMRSALSRGVTMGTLLQDEAFHFIRLGTLLERADNTARILDIKYYVLRLHGDEGATDFYQWGALLRSVTAFEVYRKAYRDAITPERVVELLILEPGMPRSLRFCVQSVVKTLNLIADGDQGKTRRVAVELFEELKADRIEDILARGLHRYLTDFMDRIYELGDEISKDYLISEPEGESAQ